MSQLNDKLLSSHSKADIDPAKLPPFVSKQQLLDWLNVTWPTLWLWQSAGKFPRPIVFEQNEKGNGLLRWSKSEIEAWIASRPRRAYKGQSDGLPGNITKLKDWYHRGKKKNGVVRATLSPTRAAEIESMDGADFSK